MTATDGALPGGSRNQGDYGGGYGADGHGHEAVAVMDTLGAYLLGASDPADDAVLERHLGRCPVCAAEAHSTGTFLEIDPSGRGTGTGTGTRTGAGAAARGADVRGADDEGLARLLAAAQARRPAQNVTVVHAAGYADRVEMTGRVLAEFTDADWERPTVEGWTARGLVAHLAAVDAMLATAFGAHFDPAPGPGETAVSWTRATQAAQRDWTARQVRQSWERGARRVCDTAADRQAHAEANVRTDATSVVAVGGMRATVADHLTDRAFETWIHSRDLAQLVGVTVPDPSPQQLRTMADLALRQLHRPWRESTRGGPPAQASAPAPAPASADFGVPEVTALEVTLTGSAGGNWLLTSDGIVTPDGLAETGTRSAAARLGATEGLRTTATPRARATLTAAATDFCLVVAARLDADHLAAEVHGDESLARALLAVAPTLARP